jgi:CheY-like chemotaxis protein
VSANRALLAEVLGRAGFHVIESSDGHDALAKAAAHAPELIILDTVMPLMGGIEMLTHLRRSQTLAKMPVIVVSADASERNARTNIDAGADVFLAKPLDLDRLLHSVAELLGMPTQPVASPSCEAVQPMVVPPRDEMFVLHRYALLGSMRDINRHADRLVTLHEKYEPFAARLRQLAMTYESQALLSLIEHHLNNEGN